MDEQVAPRVRAAFEEGEMVAAFLEGLGEAMQYQEAFILAQCWLATWPERRAPLFLDAVETPKDEAAV